MRMLPLRAANDSATDTRRGVAVSWLLLLLFLSLSCGCGGVDAQPLQPELLSTTCHMCGSTTTSAILTFPDRILPFFHLPGGDTEVTCQELQLAAAQPASPASVDCDFVQAQALYCGCPGMTTTPPEDTEEVCTLCPHGDLPSKPEFITSTGHSCQTLDTYARHFVAPTCETLRFASLQGLGFVCGCPDTQPACPVCGNNNGGGAVPNPSKVFREGTTTGILTCGAMEQQIAGYTASTCLDDIYTIELVASRCDCPGALTPICQYMQNAHLCTRELLESAATSDQQQQACECYSFCNDQFIRCHDHPGGLLEEEECIGIPISGCNWAMLQELEQDDGNGKDSSSSGAGKSAGGGMMVVRITWIVLVLVAPMVMLDR